MSRINKRALAIGAIVDIGGSIVAFAVLQIVLSSAFRSGALFSIFQDGVGLAFSFLGGFIAARLAKQLELLHAVLSVLPCFVLGIVLPSNADAVPIWHLVVSHWGMFPVALLSGYCGLVSNRSRYGSRDGR